MPAPTLYIGSGEIAGLLRISRREAQYMMAMFRDKGLTINVGRICRVSLKTFARFISEQDGSDALDTFNVLKQALKGA